MGSCVESSLPSADGVSQSFARFRRNVVAKVFRFTEYTNRTIEKGAVGAESLQFIREMN